MRLLGVLALLSAVVGCGVRGAGTTTSPSSTRTPAGNRRAAQRDAERLLSLPQLPPGSVRLAAEPGGDGRLLRRPPEGSSGLLIDRFRWWRSPRSFAAVIAFLRAHPPAGSKFSESSRTGGPGVPSNQTLGFTLPPVQGVIYSRTLLLEVVALRGGGSGVRVDAQDIWLQPRPASEQVPTGVREIDVTSALPGKRPTVSRHVDGLSEGASDHRLGGWHADRAARGVQLSSVDFAGAGRHVRLPRLARRAASGPGEA